MKKNTNSRRARSFGMNVIIRFRFLFLFLIALLVVGGYVGMGKIQLETSTESSFPKSEAVIQRNDRFKEIFGNEEFVFLLVETGDVFDRDALAYIRELSRDIEDHLPFVKDVDSLPDIEYIEVIDGDLYIDDLVSRDIPEDSAALAEIKRKVLSKSVYVDRIVTGDGAKTGISISFYEFPESVYVPAEKGFSPLKEADWPADKVLMQKDIFTEEEARGRSDLTEVSDPRKLIAPALRVILDRHQHPEYTVTATGLPVIEFGLDKIIGDETSRAVLLASLIAFGLLLVLFRSLTGILAPFSVIFAAIIITYGAMGWLDIPMSTASIVIAILLLVIAVSYSIHLLNHFRQAFRQTGQRRQAVAYTFEHATWPCFITALTTALGFASFVVVEMLPIKYLGIVCAIGTIVTYLLVMTLLPILLSFGRNRSVKASAGRKIRAREGFLSQQRLSRWADVVTRHGILVGMLTVIVFAATIYFSLNIQVDNDMLAMMGDKVSFVRDAKHVTDHLGGIYSYEVLIELPEPGMAKRPDVLQAMDEMDGLIRGYETTKMTGSLNDLIKDINQTMNENSEEFFTIPSSRDLIAQFLLLYEMSGGSELNDWVDYDYQNLRLSVQAKRYTITLREVFDEIEGFGHTHFPEGTRVTITGDIPILIRGTGALIDGQISSVFVAFAAITCVMIVVLRSVRVGLLSMIPNILPVGVVTAVMGGLQFPLENFTILVAPILIGIAVDDTVHYFVHFRQEFQSCHSYPEANRATFRKVGRAIVFTSVILTLGFSAFGFSIINSMVHLAILLGVGIMSALLADLCITPVLFVFFQPFGKAEREAISQTEVMAAEG